MKFAPAGRLPDDKGWQSEPTGARRLAMAGTGPQDGEKRALLAFLDAQRATVLAIVAGLAEETLRTPVLPSGWTPLGLVKHLGFAERHWFQRVATGSAGELPWTGMPGEEEGREAFTTGLPAEVVFGFYRDQCERAMPSWPRRRCRRRRAAGIRVTRPTRSAPDHPAHDRGDGSARWPPRHRTRADRQPRRAGAPRQPISGSSMRWCRT